MMTVMMMLLMLPLLKKNMMIHSTPTPNHGDPPNESDRVLGLGTWHIPDPNEDLKAAQA